MNNEKKDIMAEIGNFLNKGLEAKIFLSRNIELFDDLFKKMINNINEMENEKEPDIKLDPNKLLHSLRLLKNMYLETPLNSNSLSFMKNWALLTYNWNENIEKSPAIKKECNIVIRFSDDFLTLKESIETMKSLNARLKDLMGWTPPSFEIARHFINYLE